MYPVALVAGIPLGVYRRAREKPERSAWSVHVIPSHDQKKSNLDRIWKRVIDWADESDSDGIHLFLSHHRESEYPAFEDKISQSYRIVWIPSEVSKIYGTDLFAEWIYFELEFEERWRATIRPTVESPLLLPETGFLARDSVRSMWCRVRGVRPHKDDLIAVHNVITRFRTQHRTSNGWLDGRRLVFSRGPSHGGYHLPKWRRTKFTFNLPDGFHFDVRHNTGSTFRISNESGKFLTFDEYTNIDAHGHVRGGR